MSFCVMSFTKHGISLSEKLAKSLEPEEVLLFTKCSSEREKGLINTIQFVEEGIGAWTKKQMEAKNTLLFIGACGIAVRAIAPCLVDKLHDCPVLVMDEKGSYIIPILAGHVGGANEIAHKIAKLTGAVPVITTATDINQKFAVDLFAKKNALHIVNKDGIAKVSSKILAGKTLIMSVETGHILGSQSEEIKLISYPPTQPVDILITSKEIDGEALITLKPKKYVIGMGCKRGKELEKIESFISKSLEIVNIKKEQIFALSSIDKKKDEQALLAWTQKEGIPFLTFSAEELQKVKGNFHGSAFVKEQVGVDNVCERSALNVCGENGKLIYKKYAEDGMTIAIAKREWSVSLDGE